VKVRVGTRASELALVQTGWVVDRLSRANPHCQFEVVHIKTSGDRIRDVPLAQVGGKGLFVKEIEMALLDGSIDCAVHSMKDLPGEIPEPLVVAAVPVREDPRDVVVTRRPRAWTEDRSGMKVGTCSPRRAALLRSLVPEIEIVPLRGNVGTRLAKVENGVVDATLLAAAGLRRLGIVPKNWEFLDPTEVVPAIGQGCLAIEARRGELGELWSSIEDPVSRDGAEAERAFLARVAGNCVTPLAGLARIEGAEVSLDAVIADPSGERVLRDRIAGKREQAARLGRELAARMLDAGGSEILAALDAPA
jgi:hydroxymethylbilane synthase